VHCVRALAVGLVVSASLAVGGFITTPAALAADPEPDLTATLDGRPIPLEDVGKYYCDDFSYPEITCWSTRLPADARATVVTLLTAIDYVTIWDGTNYGGSFLNVSEDYSALALLGWNDRISSFKGRNSETGAFYTDWFYSGTVWAFCCNTQAPGLGAYNNTFSSIRRT
jgi:peptidase inhibitor family I36